jgi:hypothetical protein
MPDSTGSQPITEYRIVQQMRTVTGFVNDGVTVDETDRFELTAIIRTGTTTETVDQIRRWTAESLKFYDDEASSYEFRGEEFFYHLQVKQDGKFRTIKSLKPAMEPYQGDDCGDTEEVEVVYDGCPNCGSHCCNTSDCQQ